MSMLPKAPSVNGIESDAMSNQSASAVTNESVLMKPLRRFYVLLQKVVSKMPFTLQVSPASEPNPLEMEYREFVVTVLQAMQQSMETITQQKLIQGVDVDDGQ
jgi:hypothetical protein